MSLRLISFSADRLGPITSLENPFAQLNHSNSTGGKTSGGSAPCAAAADMARAPPPKRLTEAQLRAYLMSVNPYELLGIFETATPTEVEKAYRKQSLRVHPDKLRHESDEVRRQGGNAFKDLTTARHHLRDEVTRAMINSILADRRRAASRPGATLARPTAPRTIPQRRGTHGKAKILVRPHETAEHGGRCIVQVFVGVLLYRTQALFVGDDTVRTSSFGQAKSSSAEAQGSWGRLHNLKGLLGNTVLQPVSFIT